MVEVEHILNIDQSVNKNKVIQLSLCITNLSHKYYAAGWLSGVEYILWEILTNSWVDTQFGFGTLSPAELEKLSSLSLSCGGWVTYPEELINDEKYYRQFVSTDQWVVMFDNYRLQQRKS